MARRITTIARKLPFSLKRLFGVFILTWIAWGAGIMIFGIASRLFLGLDKFSSFKLIAKQPEVLNMLLLIYCAVSGLLIWFLLIKKIKVRLFLFFERKNIKQDIVYGLDLFLRSLGAVVFFGVLILLLFLLISKVTGMDFSLLRDNYMQGRESEVLNFYRQYKFGIFTFFTVVFFAPFYEEIFYRGFLHTILRRNLAKWPAIMYSSIIFAVIHGYVFNTPAVLILGIMLAFAYEKTGSLTAPLTLHFCWNLFNMLGILLKL